MKKVCFFVMALMAISIPSFAKEIQISNVEEFTNAIKNAGPGDTLVLAKGSYSIPSNLSCTKNGTATQPITITAAKLGDVVLNFDAVEGFKVSGSHWIFEKLEMHGVCENDSKCEHVFHITSGAHHTIIRENILEGFNAHIKGNGDGDPRVYPNDVRIENNEFFSKAPRQTSNPVTPIDVVGGKRWIIGHNYIHDFEKAQGNKISYAAFLKGNSSDGIFSHNLIVCESLHKGGVRLGLSFGGGGTGGKYCEEGSCRTEHRNGKMFNNIIVNCPADVGIYINKGENIQIYNNTLFNTKGIDVRFDSSKVDLRNNLLDGKIRKRNGGKATLSHNIQQGNLAAWFKDGGKLDFTLVDGEKFVDKGESITSISDDFCAKTRGTKYDIGALEFDGELCDTTTPFRMSVSVPKVDEGVREEETDMDSGIPDMGTKNVHDSGTPKGGEDLENSAGCGCMTLGSTSQNSLFSIVFIFFGVIIFIRRKTMHS